MNTPKWNMGSASARSVPGSIVIIGLGVAAFAGVFASLFTAAVGPRLMLLAALPVAIVLGLILVFSWEMLLLLILLFRTDLDPLLNLTKIGEGGAGIGLGGLVNALVIALLMLALFKKSGTAWRELRVVWGPFLLVAMITVAGTPLLIPAIKNNLDLISYAAMYILPIILVKQKKDHDRWVKLVLWSAAGPVIYGLYQVATHQGFAAAGEDEGFRIVGTFTHPNIFAFYLMLIACMLFSVYRGGLIVVTPRFKRLLPIVIVTVLTLLLFTKTRSAWAATGLFFLAYSVFIERKMLPWVLLAGLLALCVPEVRDRITDLAIGNSGLMYQRLNSYAWRKLVWTTSLAFMTADHYILGYGRASFEYYSNIFFPLANGESPAAHSVYIQLLFESGIVGVLSFAWLLFSTAKRVLKLYKIDRIEAFLITMMIVQYLLACYSDNMLDYLVFNWYFWFVAGLGTSLLWLKHQEKEARDGVPE
jgi:O-antigen ligase